MLVIWTQNAKNSLKDYMENSRIVYDNKLNNYVSSLIDYINNLNNFNQLGKFLYFRNNYEIRQLIYKMHRIFYAIHNDIVYILLISHTSRSLNNIIKYLNSQDFDNLF